MPILYSKKKHIEYSGFSDDKIFPIRKMSPLQKCIPVESMIKPWYFVVRRVFADTWVATAMPGIQAILFFSQPVPQFDSTLALKVERVL